MVKLQHDEDFLPYLIDEFLSEIRCWGLSATLFQLVFVTDRQPHSTACCWWLSFSGWWCSCLEQSAWSCSFHCCLLILSQNLFVWHFILYFFVIVQCLLTGSYSCCFGYNHTCLFTYLPVLAYLLSKCMDFCTVMWRALPNCTVHGSFRSKELEVENSVKWNYMLLCLAH